MTPLANPALSDAELAREVAIQAARLLRDLCAGGTCDGKELGDRGDSEANALILALLHEARPDDFVLSEEAADDPARCGARRVWIVDPLDGTREFCDRREDWAVHIGLAIDGTAETGAVALPASGQVFASDDAAVPPPPLPERPRIVVSRSRTPPLALAVAEALGGELVPMGSAGAKAMAVVDGQAEIYLHAGGQYEWDNCAPVAVARAAGLHCSRIDGASLVYNRADPLLPDLLICRQEYAAAVLAAVSQVEQ
ncbi:3'(2'),5'-bisphosphate nucleotidase CysQ [Sphingomonas aracearum]|uniref:3'(2'),5'-bisphosphate nucleotidase CysQ n=1 Tax=Sphingomonas aracearum TaxID=2283317 RepID=A0A369VVW2_9SPHN|nr:3'(2'),5'-bisphosphate nucleotidase CysQ [Sphingomonas aracearum]RDE05202.1 3'(2'),5'-bisphosphate nucleotidase CysQ [Sphingomonas aracearum]